jgi:hypothetical protein
MRPKAIIVDIDGTIADARHRLHFIDGTDGKKNWNQFNAMSAFDNHNQWCVDLVYNYAEAGYEIVFLTARSGSPETRKITDDWLRAHVPALIKYHLFMRKDKDFRPDFVSKQEVYNLEIAPYFDVQLAIDDKPAVCSMWRTCGITSLLCDNLEG